MDNHSPPPHYFGRTASLGLLAAIFFLIFAGAGAQQQHLVPYLVGDSAERRRRPLAYGVIFIWRDFGVVIGLIGSRLWGVQGEQLQSIFIIFAVLFALCSGIAALLHRHAQQRM